MLFPVVNIIAASMRCSSLKLSLPFPLSYCELLTTRRASFLYLHIAWISKNIYTKMKTAMTVMFMSDIFARSWRNEGPRTATVNIQSKVTPSDDAIAIMSS